MPSLGGVRLFRDNASSVIGDDISNYQLDRLSTQVVSRFRDRRLLDGLRTCQYDLILIRHCIKVAINEWGLMLSSNPVDKVKLPPSSRPRAREYRIAYVLRNATMLQLVRQTSQDGHRKSKLFEIESLDVKGRSLFRLFFKL